MTEVTQEATEEFLVAMKNRKIERDFEGEQKLKEEIADKVISGESIPIPKADVQRDYLIMIGAYIIKHSDLQFICLGEVQDATDKDKEDGINTTVVASTKHGVFRCALGTMDSCINIMKHVTDQVNDLIATQKEC